MTSHASWPVVYARLHMSLPPARPRSPLWLVVLSLACEEPMHPYRMQTLIKQRGKEHVANVAQRNSVYQTIVALHRAGLIAIHGVSREERRPERTAYEATDVGHQTLRAWIRHGLANVAREFPEFPAVLSLLDPTLRPRSWARSWRVAPWHSRRALPSLERLRPGLPRIFLLEEEYMAAIVRAELKWLHSVIADFRSGSLGFPSKAEMLRLAATMGGPSEEAIRRIETELDENSANAAGATQDRGRRRESSKQRPAKKPKRRRS
jgi:DNA-binding PadR family transcriptional regulator